jgi:hypothetical protein
MNGAIYVQNKTEEKFIAQMKLIFSCMTLKYVKKCIFSEDRNVMTEIKLCQIAIKLQLNIL